MTITATHALPATSDTPKSESSIEASTFPASFGQEQLWLFDRSQPGIPLNIPIAVRLEGPLDAMVLEQAVHQILRRHHVLRVRLDLQNGKLVQIIAPSLTLKLPVVDLQSHPPARRESEARRLSAEEARRPFDLNCAPLLRVKLLRLAARAHVFVLTAHPAVFDVESIRIFFRELAAIYQRLKACNPADLPDPPVQYGDFAIRQRERLRFVGPELAWWKKRLTGSLPTLELPTDRPRPQVPTFRGAVESRALQGALHTALQALSQQTSTPLFTSLLAAFQTLLHRYTGQEDILVVSPTTSRGTADTAELIGPFGNRVVMRCLLAGNPTFRQLVDRAQATVAGAYANGDVPFEKLVEELQPERSPGHRPPFQVMFALESAPLDSVAWPGLKLSPLEIESGTAQFDLTLCMVTSANDLIARVEYNTDLFDHATIRRMLAHFESLLEGITRDPDRHLSDLPLLSEEERHQVLLEWNRTDADYPRDKTIHELFEMQAEKTPDATAAVAGNQCLTYRELSDRANQLAHFLRKLGVGPEKLAGLCLDRSLGMLIALLGVLKAGGAYVALDPAYPRESLGFMLKDSRVAILLTQRQWLDALPRTRARRVCLDAEWKIISSESREMPRPMASPENLATVTYISGAAGKPKGVQIPHRAVVNLLDSMRREPGLNSADTLLALSPLSFDTAALELFLPLIVGARVVLATREEATDAAKLAAKIAGGGITAMQAPPVLWRHLVDSRWEGRRLLKVLSSGEALSRDLADRLLERCAELWNLYGAAETTLCSSVAKIQPGTGPIVIGRPIANTRFYILDRYLQPLPMRVPGELFIGGDGLARGYLNRPELTAGKFVRDPFNANPAARLYRTGDLARRLPDGNIELLGRADRQVKIHGYRIELGEIESMLLQFPQVREAVVTAREDTPGNKRLVAYLTTYRQATLSLNQLRRFLREKLPDAMVPAAFVMLDNLPLTANGKMDRRALPAPEGHRPRPERTLTLPRVGLEQTIAGIWEEVLSIKNPRVTDNFFDLGGHSSHVFQVQTRLHERVGADLSVPMLFGHPTIRSLAGCLLEAKKTETFAQKIHERAERQRSAAAHSRLFSARVKL